VLVRAAAAHGEGAVRRLGKPFEDVWKENDPNAYWPVELRRATALALFRAGDQIANLIRRLDQMEAVDLSLTTCIRAYHITSNKLKHGTKQDGPTKPACIFQEHSRRASGSIITKIDSFNSGLTGLAGHLGNNH